MTEEDLREIEDRLHASGNKPVRLLVATLSLDVEKLLAEVRRLNAHPAIAAARVFPESRSLTAEESEAFYAIVRKQFAAANPPEFDPNASGNLDG